MYSLQDKLLEAAAFTPLSVSSVDECCGHIAFYAWLARELQPDIVVEVGTQSGNSYFALCQALSEAGAASRCYGIVPWQAGPERDFDTAEIRAAAEKHNRDHYARFSQLMRLASHDAAREFAEASIGLLHLLRMDGRNAYESAKQEFETWLPKLTPGAVVLFHGTNDPKNQGVGKLWHELTQQYSQHLAFDHAEGLGVIQLDGGAKERVLPWLGGTPAEKQQLKDYFAALGQRQLDHCARQQALKRNARLQDKVDTQRSIIETLNKSLAADGDRRPKAKTNATELKRLQRQVAMLEQRESELLNSQSWRLTRPLRSFANSLRSLRHALRRARDLQRRQSTAGVARQALSLLRHEGVGGILGRLRARPDTANLPASDTDNGGFYAYAEPPRPCDLEARLAVLTPRVSLVVAAHRHAPGQLQATAASIAAQWYAPADVLFLLGESSTADTQALASTLLGEVRFMDMPADASVAEAMNRGVEQATGDYLMLLDAGDELTCDSLYEFARRIEADPADLLYSDEDEIDEDGDYAFPQFKPEWSPDTLMSLPYLGRSVCLRRERFAALGGLRAEAGPHVVWDFALRLAEQDPKVAHVARVLLHRGPQAPVLPDDAAASAQAALWLREDALQRRGTPARFAPVEASPGRFRVVYEPRGNPLVSIVIPTRDNGPILKRCIDSIQSGTGYRNFELIVLDNGSVDTGTLTYLDSIRQRGVAQVIRHDAPFNYSELNNIGVRAAKGDVLLFLNDDTEVLHGDWLAELVGHAQQPHVGAVGAKLLYPGGRLVQHVGVLNLRNGPAHAFCRAGVDEPGFGLRNQLNYNWLAVTGACLMVERRKFEEVGGFSEELPIAYNDIDLCMRLASAGYYNMVAAGVTLIHHESISRGADAAPERVARLRREQKQLYQRNPDFYQRDPYFSPNLRPDSPNFDLP